MTKMKKKKLSVLFSSCHILRTSYWVRSRSCNHLWQRGNQSLSDLCQIILDGKTVSEYSAVERNSMVQPKTPKHQSSNHRPKITPTLIAAGLSFGRQTLVLNQLNGAEVLQKETIFWFGFVSLQETLWHPLLFFIWGAVFSESWAGWSLEVL